MRYTFRIGLHRFGFCPEARCVFSRDTAIRTTDVPLAQTTRWRAVVRVLRSPIDSLSCALLPSSCALCGSPLPELSSVPICPVCWSEFPVHSGSVCARCGDAITTSATPTVSTLCRTCRLAPPPFVRAVSHGVYEGRMRDAIHALKYDRLHSAACELGRLMADAIAQLAGQAPAEMLVVPVPLHRSKYAQRGFNQSRSLAVEALQFLRASHPQWRLTLAPSTLMRLRATESQAGLDPRERPHQRPRCIFRLRSVKSNGAEHLAGGRHSHYRSHGPSRCANLAQCRSSFGLGCHVGARAALHRIWASHEHSPRPG